MAEKYFSGTNMKKDAVILTTNQLRQSLHSVRVGIKDRALAPNAPGSAAPACMAYFGLLL